MNRRRSRERFDEYREEFAEDPARFLDVPLLEPDQDGSSSFLLAKARIEVLDDLALLDAWIDVELRLERGPRQEVIALLNQRKVILTGIGEREERLADAPRRDPERTESVAVWADYDDGQQKTSALSTSHRQMAATDGGKSE